MLYVPLRPSLSIYLHPDTLHLQEFPIVCEPCLGPNPVRCALHASHLYILLTLIHFCSMSAWYVLAQLQPVRSSGLVSFEFLVLFFTGPTTLRSRMQGLHSSIHCIPLATRYRGTLQEDRSLSNLCEIEECLSDLSLGSSIRSTDSSPRYSTRNQETSPYK